MVKVFAVTFEKEPCGSNFYTNAITSSSYSTQMYDDRPVIVVANNIKEVAEIYPNASTITEWPSKEVKILDSVRIKCPVK